MLLAIAVLVFIDQQTRISSCDDFANITVNNQIPYGTAKRRVKRLDFQDPHRADTIPESSQLFSEPIHRLLSQHSSAEELQNGSVAFECRYTCGCVRQHEIRLTLRKTKCFSNQVGFATSRWRYNQAFTGVKTASTLIVGHRFLLPTPADLL